MKSKLTKNSKIVIKHSPKVRAAFLVEKVSDFITGLGDKADDFSFNDLASTGMFSQEQQDAMTKFFEQTLAALVVKDKEFWLVEMEQYRKTRVLTSEADRRINEHFTGALEPLFGDEYISAKLHE